jgi:hypothetical protein
VLEAVPAAPAGVEHDHLVMQRAAERTLARRAIIGACIGAFVCAGVWMLLVVVALAGSGEALAPAIGVGAICGAFGGIFLGGWLGTTLGYGVLEQVEHETLPKAP